MKKDIFVNYTPLKPYFKAETFNKINNSLDNGFFEGVKLFDADYALSVLKKTDPLIFEEYSEEIYETLKEAIVKKVSAYKKFKSEGEVFVDKENYLRKYSLRELLPDKSKEFIKIISVSSGSSGKPYFWPRSQYLELETTIIYELILKDFFNINNKNTLLIDAYSMGMYVAGVFTLNASLRISLRGGNISVITPGIDLDIILRIITEIGKEYDQIVICGYPPFVKDLIEEGIERGIKWNNFQLKFIFGAEAISEDWREYVYKKAKIEDYYTSSINTYGSADAAILGHETPLSILIKRKCHNDSHLLNRIFNGRAVSTFVQYHPHLKYFECVNDELICSTVGGLPLLRYNLHDSGKIYSFNQMVEIFSEEGIDIVKEAEKLNLPIWKLPFIVLFGKSDQTITLYGLNIYPQTIRNALENRSLIKDITTRMTASTKYDSLRNQYIEVEVELQKHHESSRLLGDRVEDKIYESLLKYNYEYKTLVEKIGKKRARLRVVLSPYGSITNNRGCKQKWIK